MALAITPDILRVLMVVPEQMSAWNLYLYTQHLRKTNRNPPAMKSRCEQAGIPVFGDGDDVACVALRDAPGRQGGISGKIFTGLCWDCPSTLLAGCLRIWAR